MFTAEEKALFRQHVRLGDIYDEIVEARSNKLSSVTITVKDKTHLRKQVVDTLRNSGYNVSVKDGAIKDEIIMTISLN